MSLATITIDTYKVVKHLLHKGYSEDQAEGLIEAIQEINLSGVATKEDMALLKEELKKEIGSVRDEIAALKLEVKSGMTELYKFMLVQALGIVGLTVTLVKLIPQF